ncbi:TetR/AcrR family transcriptional regulator [Leekyejoonella antrihumi]|uniref:TetR/AcrR family transcriptional regulator n=1 Tax=Leekyejoonella antrihumi TaxID=1660198 RepID=A0A563DVS8_9MICO|nr:TetR/AcrR family transcriptional regulator [Leekyejoonella antrihumi]TWP34317.1 TetR/AcrR family transcriptional regulator [Leekyejoonella antrihumi]
MPASKPTPRQRAHARTRDEILAAAHKELAARGADGLSLRAVAREVEMVSSAIYRYFPSKDDLLTALIIESYDAVGEATEQATGGRAAYGRRFVRGCDAFRDWGHAHPHEYALLYGSPVPGYRAPQETIVPAARTTVALLRVVEQAHLEGALGPRAPLPPASGPLRRQCHALSEALATDLPEDVLLRFAHAWSQIFGLVSLDLFGQTVGTFDPADALAAHSFRTAATQLGLRP